MNKEIKTQQKLLSNHKNGDAENQEDIMENPAEK